MAEPLPLSTATATPAPPAPTAPATTATPAPRAPAAAAATAVSAPAPRSGSAPDPGLVSGWVHGWAVSRRTAQPVPANGGHRIDVGLPGHTVRHVLPAAEPEVLRRLAATAAAPGVWLKVCAEPADVVPLLGPGWRTGDTEYLMAAPLEVIAPSQGAPADAPAGYRVETIADGSAIDVRVVSADGSPAASGRVGCAGTDAVFDQVVTEPEHRRRGLGSTVMRALAEAARARGARRGVLVATEDGRALYLALGWDLHGPVVPAVFSPADTPTGA
ncbi:GNAT family N-acetyltransferase [Kitasatospora sp. NPDC054939]